MCGIAGYVRHRGDIGDKRAVVARMCEAMHHRGPDQSGIHVEGNVALGHRRLSIIDLSGGEQPMGDEAGRTWIVFNGEIYNFPELREELAGKGYRFRTHSDTEVIIHGYRAWGAGVLDRLNGMFAFGIWDAEKRRLFLARDRLGKKPLYYHEGREAFLFASEMKSLLADPEVPREVDPGAVAKFFTFGYIPSPDTIFKGIRKLRPGHYLVWEDGRAVVTKYWDVAYRESRECRNEDEFADKLEELLKASVRRRLISDVPLGAFLSGGLDSSVVVGTMAGIMDKPVKTFTVGFSEHGYSEAADAAAVAAHFRTDHREETAKADALAMLPSLAWHFDEPFADSSAVPTGIVSRMARREVTVALSGDGGDELFAGYSRYFRRDPYRMFGRLPAGLRVGVIAQLGEAMPVGSKARNWLLGIGRSDREYQGLHAGIFPPVFGRLFAPDYLRTLKAAGDPLESQRYWSDLPEHPLSRRQYMDTKMYLPEDILVKVDRMSMAHSLETRAPLLDYTLAEFAATIPPSLQAKDGAGKYMLRKVAARILPERTLKKRKQGFAIPGNEWFRGEMRDYAREALSSREFRGRGYFDPGTVDKILSEHDLGRADYSVWIWSLLVFEQWHRVFLDAATRRI